MSVKFMKLKSFSFQFLVTLSGKIELDVTKSSHAFSFLRVVHQELVFDIHMLQKVGYR